jgi:hypothetical protein
LVSAIAAFSHLRDPTALEGFWGQLPTGRLILAPRSP